MASASGVKYAAEETGRAPSGVQRAMRLRGGAPGRKLSAAQQAQGLPPEAFKFSARYSEQLSGGASTLASASASAAPAATEASGEAGPVVVADGITEIHTYDPRIIHKYSEPWRRALVNDEPFDLASKGRNMLVGNTMIFPLLPLSLPLSLPLALIPLPMWLIPPQVGFRAGRVRLGPDGGDWVNRFVRSPLSPMSGLFTQRRSDPIEAMQRRPWMKIPLKVTGPMHQPHPSCSKIETSALTGGMVLSNKLMQVQTGDILNYFEVRVGAHSAFSCIGLMTQASYEEGDVREFDASGVPSTGDTVCFTGTGALLWNMGQDPQEKAELSLPSDESRVLRPGDRVGIVVDISIGTMAVLKNGRQVLLRKGLPCGEPMRFVVGCSKIGASFTIVAPRKARHSLKSVDWDAFYADE